MCKSVNGQHAAESTMDAFQRDTFKVGIALLTAASLSVNNGVTVHIRSNLHACMPHCRLNNAAFSNI